MQQAGVFLLINCKEIQPVHPKGNWSWIFTGRTDAKAETPILWPPDVKNWCIWKGLVAGKDRRQEEKGTTEDETVRWHHLLDGHEFEQALGVGDGHRSLACCSPLGRKESDTTEWMNWTELNMTKTSDISSNTSFYPILMILLNNNSKFSFAQTLKLGLTFIFSFSHILEKSTCKSLHFHFQNQSGI